MLKIDSIALILWLVLGLINLNKEEFSKGEYWVCYIIATLWVIRSIVEQLA